MKGIKLAEKSIETDEKKTKQLKYKRFRMFKTCVLVLTWVAQGMRTSLATAVLPDLRERLNATTAEMSYAFSMGFLGATIGAPLAVVTDRFGEHADMIICAILISGSGLIALKPLTTNLWAYASFDFVENLLFGGLPAMGNSVLLEIWGKGSKAAIQALHMGWPIGQVLGPLITIPFVSTSDKTNEPDNETLSGNLSDYSRMIGSRNGWAEQTLTNEFPEEPDLHINDRFRDDSQIEIAYWIVSAYLLLMATLFVIMEIMKTPELKTKINKSSSAWKDIFKPSHWSGGDGKFGILMFLLLSLFFIFHIGCSIGIMIYITAYAVDSGLGFSNQEGALLNAVLNLSGVLARLIAIIVAPCVSNLRMMWVLIHGELIGALLFIIWGNKTKVGLWVSTIFFGGIHRPIWGATYAWVNNYIAMLAIVIAALAFISNFFGVFQTSLYGYLYTETVIDSVFYVCSIYAAVVCFVWYAMYYMANKYGTRHERLAKKAQSDEIKVENNEMEKAHKIEQNGVSCNNEVKIERNGKIESENYQNGNCNGNIYTIGPGDFQNSDKRNSTVQKFFYNGMLQEPQSTYL